MLDIVTVILLLLAIIMIGIGVVGLGQMILDTRELGEKIDRLRAEIARKQ